MSKRLFFFLLPLALVGPSCKKEGPPAYPVYQVDLRKPKEVPLSAIAKSVHYIKLGDRAKGDPMFYPVSKVLFNDNRIAVLSEPGNLTCKVFLFDRKGNFIHFLDGSQDGPNTILGVTDMDLTEENLELLDYIKKRILRYDLNGNFVTAIPLPERFTKFICLDEHHYAFDTNNAPSERGETYAVTILSELTQKAKTFLTIPNKLRVGEFASCFFHTQEGKTLYRRYYDPTVYEITNNTVKPFYALDFGGLWIDTIKYSDSDEARTSFNQGEIIYSFFSPVIADGRMLSFAYFKRKSFLISAYQNGTEAQVFRVTYNDLDGNELPALVPIGFLPPRTLVYEIDAAAFQMKEDSIRARFPLRKPFRDFAATVHPGDNPVLMLVELKEAF